MWIAVLAAGLATFDPDTQRGLTEISVWRERDLDRYISANCPTLFASAPADPFAVQPSQVPPANRIELQYAPTNAEVYGPELHRTFT